MQPRVVLSAGNIARYHHTALALQQANFLKQYFCTFIGLSGNELWSRLLPENWRRRLQGKRVEGLDQKKCHEIPVPYLVAQTLARAGFLSEGQANLFFGTTYDQAVQRHLGDCQIFHWVHAMGLASAQKAKKHKTLCICDVRAEHIDTQEIIFREEYEILGVPYRSARASLRSRLLAEVEAANYLIVNSQYIAQTFISQGYPSHRIFVVPNGVDPRRFRVQEETEASSRSNQTALYRVLYVGQIIPEKGVYYLLQAYSNLHLPHSELILVGHIEENYRVWLKKRFPESSNIKFLGHIPQMELWRYYREGSVFVFPSLSDSFGMVVTEAMAAGLPVIVTENTGAKEIVRNGIDGYIIPIRDSDALQEKLVNLYDYPHQCQEMGQSAAARVRDFTWERYRQRLLAVYEQILMLEGN